MIDPLVSLAHAVHSGKGTYAVLLGSGVSRAAGIPTGWDVVLDLIRQIAAAQSEECEPDPETWFRTKFTKPPGYSTLLPLLAKTAAARQQLLRRYFEPTPEERERGEKLATAAHHAIAELVAAGYIRVIVTTNFDPLMENALRSIGVNPTVISSPGSARGAVPLTHSRCTVIKVHGDYLDTRLKNTPEELAKYKGGIKRLLDQVFDEYGLIVCGWSAEWDTALRRRIERCPNRRYTMYWGTRGGLTEAAKRVVADRDAVVIQIRDADDFFRRLADMVLALEQYSKPNPLDKSVAVALTKRYVETSQPIRLHDLFAQEAERVVAAISPPALALDKDDEAAPEVWRRIQLFEGVTERLIAMTAIGCFWHEGETAVWSTVLGRLANAVPLNGRTSTGTNRLRLYPAMLFLYAAGLASVASKRYYVLNALLLGVRVRDDVGHERFAGDIVTPATVLYIPFAQQMTDLSKSSTPLSDRMRDVLREPMRSLLPDEIEYDKCFDRFEYIRHIVNVYGHRYLAWETSRAIGRFVRRHHTFNVLADIEKEYQRHGDDWPLLKAGIFSNAREYQVAREVADQAISESG